MQHCKARKDWNEQKTVKQEDWNEQNIEKTSFSKL